MVVWTCKLCCNVMQWVSVCCSVLRCVAVCCGVLQCAAVCCIVLQCVTVCCGALQCVAVRCSALQIVCSLCIQKYTSLAANNSDHEHSMFTGAIWHHSCVGNIHLLPLCCCIHVLPRQHSCVAMATFMCYVLQCVAVRLLFVHSEIHVTCCQQF